MDRDEYTTAWVVARLTPSVVASAVYPMNEQIQAINSPKHKDFIIPP